jgi:hypothetical protein
MTLQNFLEEIYNKYYLKFFSSYYKELKKAVGDSKSLLDVGCGKNSPIQFFSEGMYSVGVDAHKPSIKRSKQKNIHNEYYNIDVLDIGKKFLPGSYDCVIALDLVEHLEKEDGVRLLQMMERIAKEKVIVFTPKGFLSQSEHDNNPWQVHKSGWEVEEMRSKGYEVIGINGWKPLRGECAIPKLWPKFFWIIVSDITQLFVRNKPEKAFQILCVKIISKKTKDRR